MYDIGSPLLHRSRIILGDRSAKKVEFIGKSDLVHSRTHYPVILYDVSFVPDLGLNLFFFDVVQGKHKIILNKTGAHLLGGRPVFPRRCNGSSLRATKVLSGENANASTALATIEQPPFYRSDGPLSLLPNSSVASPDAHHHKSGVSSSCRAKIAVAKTSEQNYCVLWRSGRKSKSMSEE